MQIFEKSIIDRFVKITTEHSRKLADMQSRVMDSRQSHMLFIAGSIGSQIGNPTYHKKYKPSAIYEYEWLKEFALGDITHCLGKEFQIYEGRKSPRIPNGDFLLISRVLEINGTRGDFSNKSSIETEFDVEPDVWFLASGNSATVPLSILMEIALQPCGVLSAWLHTQLRHPQIDFLFRNLDGSLTFFKPADLRGRSIKTRAILEKTVFSSSIIIQHFSFELSLDGDVFLSGQTTFGYFPEETMSVQSGLDAGQKILPWGHKPENQGLLSVVDNANRRDTIKKLCFIDEMAVSGITKDNPHGYIQASRKNNPNDWYYSNHFLGDPVMPGSLGVEMIVQAFRYGVDRLMQSDSTWQLTPGKEFIWRYRGQVLPANFRVDIDIQLMDVSETSENITITGKANLWADGLRIYELQNLAFTRLKKD